MIGFPYLKGSYKEEAGSLFTRSHLEKTRGKGYKFHQKFFRVRTIKHWNNLHRGMEESPSLEVFKMGVDKVLDDLIWVPFPMKSGTRRSFKVPSNLGCSMIL